MGTRSTTKIYDNGELVLALYKQFDGYTSGWGNELIDFIKSGKVVNGLSLKESQRVFNGCGDFALQLVAHFKTEAGGLYATTKDDEQEYNYVINFDYDYKNGVTKISLKCKEEAFFRLEIETDMKKGESKILIENRGED